VLLAVLPTPCPEHGVCVSHIPGLPKTRCILSRCVASCAWSPELAHSSYSKPLCSIQLFPGTAPAGTCATTAYTQDSASSRIPGIRCARVGRSISRVYLVAAWQLLDRPLVQQIPPFGGCFPSGVEVPDPQAERCGIPQELLFIKKILLRGHQVLECVFCHCETDWLARTLGDREPR
jgi:hypothetical protein